MFADDATLSVSASSFESVETQLNQAMNEVYRWTVKNKLILNAKKTKVMLLGSRQRLNTLHDKELKVKINNIELDCVTETKCLGVIIDNTLSFKHHVNYIVKGMQQKLGIIEELNVYLPHINLANCTGGSFCLTHCTAQTFGH